MQIIKRYFSYFLLCSMAALYSVSALADAKITNVSGQVQIAKPNGSNVPAQVGSIVKVGESIVTSADGFARAETTDGALIVLRPNSEFFIEAYQYEAAKPANDNFVYRLIKGAMRTATGLIGKRGNPGAYSGKTPTATIGIRGTDYDVRVCQGDCGDLADGTYIALRSGSIVVSNAFGELTMTAGQIVFVSANEAPVLLESDPGISFTQPADFPEFIEDSDEGASCEIK